MKSEWRRLETGGSAPPAGDLLVCLAHNDGLVSAIVVVVQVKADVVQGRWHDTPLLHLHALIGVEGDIGAQG